MANVEKLTIGSDTYDLRDASAVHTVDSAMSSSSTNPVQNKVVKEYVDDAIQNEPYIRVTIGFGVMVLFENFTTSPTTYSGLVADADFKMALARPVVVDYGSIGTTIIQCLILNMDSIPASNHWQFRFPDAVVFNGTLTNGLEGDLTYAEGDGWYLDNLEVCTPEFKNYTDEAITNLSLVSTQVAANATEAATPASGDGLIFADSDDSNKLKRMTNGFGTSTTTFLRNDGTWAAPPSSEAPVARIFHGTCSTAAGTTAKVVTCPQFLESDLVTGAIVFVTFTATNSGAVASITLNVNGTGAKNIKYMRNAAESNLPAVGYLRANMTYRFVYNGTYWVCDTDYDANTVTELTYRTFRVASDAGGSLYSYKLCALDNNGDLIPFNFVSSSPTTAYAKDITTHSFNPFRGFLYYSGTTTTSAGSGRDASEFKSAVQFDCRYSLNINSSGTAGSTALTSYDPIYVKALYTTSTRLAKLVADTSSGNYLVRSSVVQALPTADPNTGLADGTFYIYILLGQVYSKYQIDMFDNNTVYYWNTKAGMMTEFTGIIEADYATPADISTAINALDSDVSGLGAGKTITALSEQNGVISASASDISISASQVATGTFASNRIYSDATMATAIESGDAVIFADSSDSNKVKRMSNGFDTTKTTEFLRRDGSWAAPPSGTNTTYTFTDGTNGFTVTPSDGTAQTVNVTPSISEIKNDLTLLKEGTTPGDSHSLIFQRGTLTDNYNDWRIQDRGGFLYFDQRGSGSTSWANQVVFNTSGNVSATTFTGNGASLTSLNASNISSGTLNAARLPSGLEYTSNMTQYVNSSSIATEYPSAKAVYDSLDSITILTSDAYYGFSVDATPATGTLTSGTVAQATGNNLRDLLNSGKSVVIYDDDQLFDFDGNGYSLTFYATVDAGSFVSFRYFKDADGDTRDYELRITTSDTFAIYEVSYSSGSDIWTESTTHGAVYPADAVLTDNTFADGSLTIIGQDLKDTTGMVTGIGSINMAAYSTLSCSAQSGATSYTIASGLNAIGANSNSYDYIKSLYFFTKNGKKALKPTSVAVSGSSVVLTFAESLNPTAAITYLGYYNNCSGANSLVTAIGATNTNSCNVVVGSRLANTGYYSMLGGLRNSNSGNGCAVFGRNSINTGAYSFVAGSNNTNAKSEACLIGKGHDSSLGSDSVAAVGQYSAIASTTAFAVGNGADMTNRSNAFEVSLTGEAEAIEFVENGESLADKYSLKSHTHGIFKGTCGTGAAGDPKVVQCPEFTSSDLVKGAVIFVTFTYTNSVSVNTVQMNVNGTGAKRIMQLKNTVLGTMTTNGELVANQTYMFTYDGTYWVLSNDDDRTNVTSLGDGFKNIGTTYRYQFLVSAPKDDTNATDHKRAMFAINAVNTGTTTYTKAFRTWSFDPFGIFAYWNSTDTVSSEGTFGDPTRLLIECSVVATYGFNVKQNGTAGTQGFVANKAVYMKSKYDFATQTATLWQNTASENYLDRSGLVQELPTTNPNTSTDTYIYIYLGQAYGDGARLFYLVPHHPVYMWNEAKGRMDLFTGGPMEGSGTCELTDGSNVNITANYYKVGKQVTVSGVIPATSSTASSLSGLPFAAKDSAQLTLSWTDALLTSSVWGRLSVVSGSTNLYTTGYVKIGTTSSHNAGSWLGQVASPGVAFSITYITDVP